MSRQYTNKTEVENYLLITVDSSFSSQIGTWIEQVSKRIEQETGRVFIADDTASVRLFEISRKDSDTVGRYRENARDIFIDDAVEITKVVVDGTEVSSSIYLAYPANETPKVRVSIINTASNVLTAYNQNIQVTGKWGYSTSVPDDIKFAATVLTAQIIQQSLPHQGRLQSVSIGRYSATYARDKLITDLDRVKEILEEYKRLY